MTPPQMVAAAFGVALAGASAFFFLRNRIFRFRAIVGLIVGGGLLFAAFRPEVIVLMGPDSDVLRLRWIVGLLSLLVGTATLEAIRAGRMRERYALLWLASGATLLIGAVSPLLSRWVERLTGMSYGAVASVTVFAFVLLLLFHLCVALSGAQDRIAALSRELALLDERLRRLTAPASEKSPPRDGTPPASDGRSAPR